MARPAHRASSEASPRSSLRIGTRRVALVLAGSLASAGAAAEAVTYADLEPLFRAHCTICHSGDAAPRGLRLDTYGGILEGGENGAVVGPGEPEASELMRRLTGESLPRMPLTGPPWVSDADLARVAAWTAAGAPEGSAGAAGAAAQPLPAAQRDGRSFEDVRPLLLQRCARCHSDNGIMEAAPEGLRLDTWENLISGGDRIVIVPGSAGASELWRRIEGLARPRMPFDGPPFLSPDEIALVRRWIDNGAPGPDRGRAPMPVGGEVRLHGRLTGRWLLDGQALDLRGAEVRKAPRIGDYVEVRGRVGPDGRIRVERLRAR